jgi:hypothetical protein
MRLPTGELLALACSGNPRRALADYTHRWTIETLFANLKTKGFNMEGTHITDPDKLSTLLAVLALAVALAVKAPCGQIRIDPRRAGPQPDPRQAGLGEHPHHRSAVYVEVPGDGGGRPFLDVMIAQNLSLAFRGDRHDRVVLGEVG